MWSFRLSQLYQEALTHLNTLKKQEDIARNTLLIAAGITINFYLIYCLESEYANCRLKEDHISTLQDAFSKFYFKGKYNLVNLPFRRQQPGNSQTSRRYKWN